MMIPHLNQLSRYAGILSVSLLAGTAAWPQDTGKPVMTATVVFRDGASFRLGIEDTPLPVDTIAGRLRLRTRDIATADVAESGGNAIIALGDGERWTVDARKLVNALLGGQAMQTLDAENHVIGSISISGAGTPHRSANHGYKVLFKDESTAIIDPVTVVLPVQLESGKVELPLGTVSAVRFAIPDGQAFPKSVFLRLRSGQIHQLPWTMRKQSFTCGNISGRTLTIAYADILGILPVDSDMPHDSEDAPTPLFRLGHADGTETTSPVPLQVLSFNTPSGQISLPSPFVASFTIPQEWRGHGKVSTIYGECFKGRPDFRSLLHYHDGTVQPVAVKSLLRAEQVPAQAHLPLPYSATVFSLSGGCTLAGVPDSSASLLETTAGEAIIPEAGGFVTRSRSDLWMYTPPQGAPVLCRPISPEIGLCLASTGQRVILDLEDVEKIAFNSPISSTTNLEGDMNGNDLEAALPSATLDKPAGYLGPGPATQAGESRPESPVSPLFGWFRDLTRDDPGETSTTLTVELPWGKIDLETDQVSTIHQMADDDSAIIMTTKGDVIITAATPWREGGMPESITNRVVTNTVAAFSMPAYARQTGNAVRIRLARGDIITGTFDADHVPFAPMDKNDPRDQIPVDTLRKIIRTGDDTFLYETGRGSLTGKSTRDMVAFQPAASQTAIGIALRDIEALMADGEPLPPPIMPAASLPPALCGLAHLSGGEFIQGSGDTGMTDETPRITVTLSPFLLDATEVTHAQFAAFVRDSGYETTAEETGATTTWMNPGFLQQPDDPVVCVTWNDAAEFCNWRSRQSSLQPVYEFHRDGRITTDRVADGFRLPTESEWEFAAGGMRKTAYPWGNTFATATTSGLLSNFLQRDGDRDDGWRWTNPVNAFPPDPNGIYGMAGNVWEWCEDWYFDRAYDALKNRSPLNPCIQQADVPGLTHRVMRGGSYRNTPDLLRTASRGSGLPHAYAPHVGFRCARNAN